MNTFLSAYNGLAVPRSILNISSGAAQRAVDGWGAYCASKAALDALTRTAQKEQDIRSSGIRIRSLSPGVLDTAMQEHIRSADQQRFSEVASFERMHAEGHLVEPQEAASKIVAWLQRPSKTGEEVVLRINDLA
jgi:benzil reductase ((S)-benzoin forming)